MQGIWQSAYQEEETIAVCAEKRSNNQSMRYHHDHHNHRFDHQHRHNYQCSITSIFYQVIAIIIHIIITVVITTIHRTLASLALAKIALEYVFRLVPAGTHDPARFVKPSELRSEFAAAGITLDDMTGFAPRPARRIGGNGFVRTATMAINYAASGSHS